MHWAEYNPDLAREEDRNYPSTTLHPKRVSSIPLVEWDQLWPARDVTDPVSIRLHIDGEVLGSKFSTMIESVCECDLRATCQSRFWTDTRSIHLLLPTSPRCRAWTYQSPRISPK